MFVLSLGFAPGCAEAPPELSGPAEEETVRRLPAGELVGFTSPDDAHVWLGIPFAEPPVGELRWRAPRSAPPWSGRLEATAFGPSCIQLANQAGGRDGAKEGEVTGSEDCLYLNVYAPKFAPDAVPRGEERLPVMVWIHGGGNSVGDAVFYDGSELATREQVIVVTVHYRLGVLGWFSHPSLRAAGTGAEDASGNYGTLDIARSLAWVQENISGFGGDPERVVVFGESAGGSNVFSMLLSPTAAGLFAGAIAQSGSAVTVSRANAENFVDDSEPGDAFSSSENFVRYLIDDGRAENREQAIALLGRMNDEEAAAFLRSRTPGQLLSVFADSGFGGMYHAPELIRDGAVLPAEPAVEAFQRGHYNQVPTILGTNRDEMRLFHLFSSPYVARVFGLPLWLRDAELYHAMADHPSRMWKVRGADAPARGMRAIQGPSVYAYRFDWDEEPSFLMLDIAEAIGAGHAIEIPFVFGWLSLGPGTRFVFDEEKQDENRWLSNQMMSYWSNFAYTGSPGRGRGGDQVAWNAWSNEVGSETFLVFDSRADGGIRMSTSPALTRERVFAGIAGDDRLADRLDLRCALYRGFVERRGDMSAAEYREVEAGECERAYPLAEKPVSG